MSMYLTVVEEGDIILVRGPYADDPLLSVDINQDTYYVMRDHKLVEVPWYEASDYQRPFAESIKRKRGFS